MASKVKYPLTCISGGQRLSYCYGLLEELLEAHNREGVKFTAAINSHDKGDITDAEFADAATVWKEYLVNDFGVKEDVIIAALNYQKEYAQLRSYWKPDLKRDIVEVA